MLTRGADPQSKDLLFLVFCFPSFVGETWCRGVIHQSINQSINQSRNHSCILSFLCAVERNLTFGKWGNIQEIGKRTTNTSSLEGREVGKMYQSVWLFYAIYRWQTQTEEFTERPFSQACEVCYCLIFEFIKFNFPRLRWFLNSGKISRKSGSSFGFFTFIS